MEYRKLLCEIFCMEYWKLFCASVSLLTQFLSRRKIPTKIRMHQNCGQARTAPICQASSFSSPESPPLYLPLYLSTLSHPLHLFPLINLTFKLAHRGLMLHANRFCLRCFLSCSAAGPSMQCRAHISRLHLRTLIHRDFPPPPLPSHHDPPTHPPFPGRQRTPGAPAHARRARPTACLTWPRA